QVDVILGFEIKGAGVAPAAHFDVFALVLAYRHRLVGQVGNGLGDGVPVGQHLVQLHFGGVEIVIDLGDGGTQRGDIFAAAGSFAYGLGAGVALVLQLLSANL